MTTIRKILTLSSLLAVFGFAQGSPEPPPQSTDDWDNWTEASASPDTASQVQAAVPDSAVKDSSVAQAVVDSVKTVDTAKVAEVSKDSVQVVPEPADTVVRKKPRNKITYEEYQARNMRAAKKRSRTLHHGLSIAGATYHDKNYWRMDHEANWGTGVGMYYFYRRYFGQHLGFQGRLGGLYRYSRWTFDVSEKNEKLSSGEEYTLVHNLDRKYFNFSADMPLTGKYGYHVKGTATYIFTSLTLGLTKPIYEMTDTENRLYLKTKDDKLKADLELINSVGQNPFPVYESHQTNKFFYMDDWETSGWIGLGIENRLVSFEFQMFALGGVSQNANHRYYHIGCGSSPTWRLFLDFSIR